MASLLAFYRNGRSLIKVYDADRDDVFAKINNEREYWFSKSGRSLREIATIAVEKTCEYEGEAFDLAAIIFTAGA